ncbi:hypothetical protein pb186bvf_017381 [Paramecium bursaria]
MIVISPKQVCAAQNKITPPLQISIFLVPSYNKFENIFMNKQQEIIYNQNQLE